MKKTLALILSIAMLCVLLAACGEKGDGATGDVTLKVWASQEDQELVKDIADKFKAQYTSANITFEFGVVGEPDAYKTFSEDPAAAADVFAFPNDQLRDFVKAGGLYEITRNKDAITSRNGEGSVGSATLDGKLYGYPMTADNGYFLYYDKSVLSEDDVKSLDKILEVSDAAGKKVFMDVSNGWYIASFFLAKGSLSIDANEKQVCDFNNADGLAAAQAIYDFTGHPAFVTGDDDVLKGGIGGSIAAGVSGTWNADAISAALGSNYAATKLPTFTLGGSQVQMSSFGGYKLIGINATITDANKLVAAMDFADFMTNEENQVLRFEKRAMGPSNTKAAANPAVMENVALAALAAQSAYAVSQNDVLGNYWSPAEAFGTAMENRDSTDLQTLLDNMVAQIQS